MQLYFIVEGQRLFLAKKETVVAESINYLTAGVGFSSSRDWDGLEKWMHFKLGDQHYVINLIDDQITADRGVNLSAGDWEVFMHGNVFENGETKQRITTNTIKLTVQECGDLHGEPFPDTPPSSGEQIIAQAVQARDAAIAAAIRAENAAGSGGEPGGEPGGGGSFYYKIGDGLKIVGGDTLSVDTATVVQQDNTKPVTSGAVYTEVGNINALLATI